VTVIAEILADTSARMDRAVEAAKDDFATVRTGRANPQLFQKILVDYYGSPTPLAQLASLNTPEARTLVVTPYDKSAQGDRAGDPRHAEPGREPVQRRQHRARHDARTDGRASQGVRQARSHQGEDAKVHLRGIRRKAKDELDALKSEVGEDDLVRAEKELDAVTRSHVDEIDEALKRKEAELLEV
jgi:ribosome recycling factor